MNNVLLFATSNPHKLREVRSILGTSFVVKGLDSLDFEGEIPETHDTIEGNAVQKVEYIADYTESAVFAEDTGLIVPALDGAPGVHSARYAGEHKSDQDNMARLLHELEAKSLDRSAFFKTVVAYRNSHGNIATFTGEVHGQIASAPKGNKGFGYDPVFVPDGFDLSFAELGDEIKNRISHRRKAMEKFIAYIQQKGTG